MSVRVDWQVALSPTIPEIIRQPEQTSRRHKSELYRFQNASSSQSSTNHSTVAAVKIHPNIILGCRFTFLNLINGTQMLTCLCVFVRFELSISSYQKLIYRVRCSTKVLLVFFVFAACCSIVTVYADIRHKSLIKRLSKCVVFTLAACAPSLVFEWGTYNRLQCSMSTTELPLCYTHWG